MQHKLCKVSTRSARRFGGHPRKTYGRGGVHPPPPLARVNPSKCKSFRMTLKTKPLITSCFTGDEVLEHNEIRDLGVILDTKLTFGPHVNQIVTKSNRALGVLIRWYQRAAPGRHLNVSYVLTPYFAHVRSNLKYCSVIWNGAAAMHADRVGRVEHKFLISLNAVSLSMPLASFVVRRSAKTF